MGDSSNSGPRRRAEHILVQSIMGRVQATTNDLIVDRRAGKIATAFTDVEKPIFSRFSYHGWIYGVPAGAAVFGIVFGGLRFAAYRRFVKARALPNSAIYHARKSTSRQAYAALDRPGTAAAARSQIPLPSTTTPPAQESFTIFADDVLTRVELMVTMALSLFVITLTNNLMPDSERFHRDLSSVPLKPGTSLLCLELCPQIVQHRNELLTLTSMHPLYEQQLREKPRAEDGSSSIQKSAIGAESPSPYVQSILQFNPKELWEDPVTEDLESMVILVQNCQHRMDFENECRRRNHQVDESTGLVNVPEPGVPLHFHKSSTES